MFGVRDCVPLTLEPLGVTRLTSTDTTIVLAVLRGRIHREISARAEISARLLGDGKEGENVLNKKHEVWKIQKVPCEER